MPCPVPYPYNNCWHCTVEWWKKYLKFCKQTLGIKTTFRQTSVTTGKLRRTYHADHKISFPRHEQRKGILNKKMAKSIMGDQTFSFSIIKQTLIQTKTWENLKTSTNQHQIKAQCKKLTNIIKKKRYRGYTKVECSKEKLHRCWTIKKKKHGHLPPGTKPWKTNDTVQGCNNKRQIIVTWTIKRKRKAHKDTKTK